ncbi:MAG: SGNH/GDSL hydrolase N-terminal domain-containing protein, partial [Clostridia bacterium]
MIFRDVREDPFQVYGLYNYKEEPVFRRLPQSVAEQANEGVQNLHTNTAGGRVKFKTNSKT